MKYLYLLIFLVVSCKTVQLTDGTYITKRQERKIYKQVFNDTFGQMTEEEVKLFKDVSFDADTNVRVITVYTDTSYVEQPSYTIYTELIPSEGDTTILYDGQFFILNNISYINFDTTVWVNYRGVTVYR
jgi:hypothetical protein